MLEQTMYWLYITFFEVVSALNLKPVNDHSLVHVVDSASTTPLSGQQFQSLSTPLLGLEPAADANRDIGDVEKEINLITKQPNRRSRRTFDCDICERSLRIRHLYQSPKNGQGELLCQHDNMKICKQCMAQVGYRCPFCRLQHPEKVGFWTCCQHTFSVLSVEEKKILKIKNFLSVEEKKQSELKQVPHTTTLESKVMLFVPNLKFA